jgi:hypothetical protein
MKREKIIRKIKNTIEQYGTFYIGEVNGSEGIIVNEMGDLIALAEYFNGTTIELNVYDMNSISCDEIHTYELTYDALPKHILEEILFLVDLYETDNEKTFKRTQN